MAKDDKSIKIGSGDDLSKSLITIKNSDKLFGNDITGMQNKLTQLDKTKATLKIDTDKAKKELENVEKKVGNTKKGFKQLDHEMAIAKYETARRNLALVSASASDTEKKMASLTNTVSKSEKRVNSTKALLNGAVEDYASAGVEAIVEGSIKMATTYAGSAFGSEGGTITNNVLSMGAMGAAIGTSIAPGIGTAVGALGGALFGYFQAKAQIFENKDQAFKSYYEDLYNSVLQSQNQSLTNGSAVAAKRETNKLPFSTLLGGEDKADNFLGSLSDFANSTTYDYDELVNISKNLLSSGYRQEDVLPLLEKVGDAGSALGMSKDDVANVAVALGQLQTNDKVTLEDLSPLLQRGIDVWSYLAAGSTSKKDIHDMVSDGDLSGQEAAKDIVNGLNGDFAGNMDKQSNTYSGLVENLKESQDTLDSAMGEGYNSTREGGMEKQIDWLNGDSGAKMQEAYSQIGQWKASLDNLSEQYQRDAMDSVMSGTIADSYKESDQKGALESLAKEYQAAKQDYDRYSKHGDEENAQKASAAMGRILEETQAIGVNEYNASDEAQLAQKSNLVLAENIKNDSATQEAYYNAGATMAEQFTLGLASKTNSRAFYKSLLPKIPASTDNSNTGRPSVPGIPSVGPGSFVNPSFTGKGNAYGLSYVPYNNYPALLHEGERVLTASENRSTRTNRPITITGNNFNIRQESDITKTAQEIAKLINQAYALAP